MRPARQLCAPTRRALATAASPSSLVVFDRNAKVAQRDRAVRNVELSRLTDYVRNNVAESMIDRLLDIRRRFSTIVDLGAGAGYIARHLEPGMCDRVIMCEASRGLLHRDGDEEFDLPVERMIVDEEALPFDEDSQEAILSSMALHWVNDLPGALIQIRRSLKPDGVFIGAVLGGDTLFELRTSLQLAELEREGGISPRVSPMTDSQSMSSLLNRAGFALPTVDVDEVKINYPSIFELVEDLRAMGESNAVLQRRPHLHRDSLMAAAAIYQQLHGNLDGSIPATFQIIYAIGWKPDPSQPKPLPRGSAKTSLRDVLEDPLGEKN